MKSVIKIPDGVTNQDVAEAIDKVVSTLVFNFTNNVTIQIKDNNEISIEAREPLEKTNIEVTEGTTAMITKLKSDSNTARHASFMTTEWVVEMWLKYGITYFYAEYDKSTSELKFFWNKGIGKEFIQSYWVEDKSNGWNVEGMFWQREWMKAEHEVSPGSGKTGRR